jgi:hypothetical protein
MPQELEALHEAARQRRKESKRKPLAQRPGDKPPDMKRVGQRPPPAVRPVPIGAAAPPKIDLATLLNPALAPKHAMPVGPIAPAAAGPTIGDVIPYDTADDQASLPPMETPQRKRRRPLREYESQSEPIEQLDQARREEVGGQRVREGRGVGDARAERGGRGPKPHMPRGLRAKARPSKEQRPRKKFKKRRGK